MGFKPSNLATPAFVFKFVELVFVFIVFMIFRCGASGDIFYWGIGPSAYPTPAPTPTASSTTTTTTPASSEKPNKANTSDANSQALTQNSVLAQGNTSDSSVKKKNETMDKNPTYNSFYKMTERAENDLVFGIMTSAGYFYITIILMAGIVLGDNARISLFLFNLFGFLFFIAIGSEQIDIAGQHSQGKHTANGMGAMAILTSFVFLVDTVFVVRDLASNKE